MPRYSSAHNSNRPAVPTPEKADDKYTHASESPDRAHHRQRDERDDQPAPGAQGRATDRKAAEHDHGASVRKHVDQPCGQAQFLARAGPEHRREKRDVHPAPAGAKSKAMQHEPVVERDARLPTGGRARRRPTFSGCFRLGLPSVLFLPFIGQNKPSLPRNGPQIPHRFRPKIHRKSGYPKRASAPIMHSKAL